MSHPLHLIYGFALCIVLSFSFCAAYSYLGTTCLGALRMFILSFRSCLFYYDSQDSGGIQTRVKALTSRISDLSVPLSYRDLNFLVLLLLCSIVHLKNLNIIKAANQIVLNGTLNNIISNFESEIDLRPCPINVETVQNIVRINTTPFLSD